MPDDELPLSPLTMAILLALAERERHGYALMRAVEQQSDGTLRPGTGSLYAALERLMSAGLIQEAGADREPGPGRPRKIFRITVAGREQVRGEATRMLRVLRIARERKLVPEVGEGPTSNGDA